MWTPPSITEQRAAMGLSTPTEAERDFVWSQMSIPQAGISAETGGYRPHRIIKRIHNGPWRFVAIGGSLRVGKSLGAAAEIISWLPHSNLIWLAAETYDLTRQEFEFAAEGATSLDYVQNVTMPSQKYMPCSLETDWGCRIETRSLHDLGAAGQGASLVARAPDLVVICEPGFAPFESLQHATERLATRRGRLWMAGTFERANTWYVETWRKWTRWPNEDMGKSIALPAWLNTVSFPGGREDPELMVQKRKYATLREYLVRWGGVPLASEALVMGAYWNPKTMVQESAVFQSHGHDGMKLPVELAIDPGYSGNSVYAVLAIQRHGSQAVVIDEVTAQSLVHEEVIDLCRTKPWWPHVTGGIIDPYAGPAHAVGASSPQDIWWRYAHVPIELAPRYAVEDIVSRLQFMLRDPSNARSKITITPKAKRLYWEMEHWRRITTREGMGKPSDAHCDAIKALAYFVTAKYSDEGYNPINAPIVVSDYSIGGRDPGVSVADRYANYRERI